MNNQILEEVKKEIIKKYGQSERGCYINGNWLSPQDIIKIIEKVDKEY